MSKYGWIASQKKARQRRRKAFTRRVAKANAEYDQLHGGAKVIKLTPEEDRP